MSDDEDLGDIEGIDKEGAREDRDEAIERVDDNADKEFKESADSCLRIWALMNPYLTANDVRDEMRKLYPEACTHDDRAMGPVMKRARARGLIEPTDRVENSGRRRNHHRPLRVWRSLVCIRR